MGVFQRLFGSRRRPDPAQLAAAWERFDRARALMDALAYSEAASHLTAALADLGPPTGKTALFRGEVLGALGECHFQNGDAERAAAFTADAIRQEPLPLELWQSLHGNLYEIHRYRGQSAEAAVQADILAGLADQQGRADEAARYRRQAVRVGAGEPPCRVVVDVDGARMEVDAVLAGAPGQLSFRIERNRLTLRPAQHLLDAGERTANEGKFAEALSLFRAAARCDRFAPQPRLQAGLMLLYLKQPVEAQCCLRECESLAPRWPLVRPALHLAGQRADNRIPHEVFRLWHALEEGPLPAEMKVRLAEQALDLAPHLPHLHHLRGKNLRERNLAFAAVKAYRRALELSPPPDLETRLCVDLAAVVEDDAERRRLLRRAIDLDADLVATATARIVLRFD